MGKSMDEIALLLFPNVSAVRRGELMQQCCIYENRHLAKVGGMLYPALEETLMTLKERYNLMIVSNCQSGYIETFLEHYGFQYLFTDCECFGNTGRCKGENIQMVVRRNGLKQACYVGDTIGDAQASQIAGIPFIFASYGFGHVENPLYRIAHFAQLPEVAAKIFGR